MIIERVGGSWGLIKPIIPKWHSQTGHVLLVIMKGKAQNIRLAYLYRDAENNKVYGEVIFSNPTNLYLDQIEKEIGTYLISGVYFDPDEVGIPRLQFAKWNSTVDHIWNEFESLELTQEQKNTNMTIVDFLERIKQK